MLYKIRVYEAGEDYWETGDWDGWDAWFVIRLNRTYILRHIYNPKLWKHWDVWYRKERPNKWFSIH